MKFVADLHVHSHYSRATSKNLNLENMAKWAQLKVIQLVGTVDFVQPGWMAEIREKLQPAEPGLFRLRPEYARATQNEVPASCAAEVRFMLTVEISNIYKRHDKVRKVHNLIFAPDFAAAEKIQAKLDSIGNIHADGRPILGLDSHDLLEIALDSDPSVIFVPAHIWTPWFSALGSKGGFDSMEAYLGDLLPHVFAVETGLSSDPPMNWRLSQLDPYVLISNSDAHSPAKLGREATLFDSEFSYPAIYQALSQPEKGGLVGTLEFFPEEGKYHYDGHRSCKQRLHPSETLIHEGLCPVCKKPVIVGVLARVEKLADRERNSNDRPPHWRPYLSLIPLPEIISDVKQVGAASKTVQSAYQQLLARLGNELFVLRDAELNDIEKAAGSLLAEAIRRVRAGQVDIASGYDGEFGEIRIFKDDERLEWQRQNTFFPENPAQTNGKTRNDAKHDRAEPGTIKTSENINMQIPADKLKESQAPESGDAKKTAVASVSDVQIGNQLPEKVNAAQWRAVTHAGGHLLIVAGPGTGKTHTLTMRIAHVVQCFDPGGDILAITFTNKAAEEMQQRLQPRLQDENIVVTATTFHSFCLHFLRMHRDAARIPADFNIATERDIEQTLKACWPEASAAERKKRKLTISAWKARADFTEISEDVEQYNQALRAQGLLDFDDLIVEALYLLQNDTKIHKATRATYPYIFVDEYQDINAAQHALLLALTGEKTLVTAIGDPNQAIYSFRGSDAGFFARFTEDFPGAKVMQLGDNYRSGQNILSASGQVIARNSLGELPALTAKIAQSGQLTLHETASEDAEAEYIVHCIEKLVGGTSMFSQDSGRVLSEKDSEVSFGDIAVLYRLNSQRKALEEAFARSGIPYQVSGDKPLVAQPGVSHILTVLQLAGAMPVPVERVSALMHELIDGVGEQTTTALFADDQSTSEQITFERLLQRVAGKKAGLGRAATAIQAFIQDITDLQARLGDVGIAATLQHLFVLGGWQRKLSQDERLAQAWQRLSRLALLCSGLREFIDELHLQRANDALDARAERISLMTLHAAKGLEFPVVFIAGCEQNLLPLQLDGYASTIDEERRLFYVGMTRAKEQLFLLRAKKRTLFGKTRDTAPSPFWADIEDALKMYDVSSVRKAKRDKKTVANQMDLFG